MEDAFLAALIVLSSLIALALLGVALAFGRLGSAIREVREATAALSERIAQRHALAREMADGAGHDEVQAIADLCRRSGEAAQLAERAEIENALTARLREGLGRCAGAGDEDRFAARLREIERDIRTAQCEYAEATERLFRSARSLPLRLFARGLAGRTRQTFDVALVTEEIS